MLTQAWALTELAALPLHSAILGLTLTDLIPWLQTHFARVGEHSRRTRQPQLLALWNAAELTCPP